MDYQDAKLCSQAQPYCHSTTHRHASSLEAGFAPLPTSAARATYTHPSRSTGRQKTMATPRATNAEDNPAVIVSFGETRSGSARVSTLAVFAKLRSATGHEDEVQCLFVRRGACPITIHPPTARAAQARGGNRRVFVTCMLVCLASRSLSMCLCLSCPPCLN